jgi:hypothetical protein
MNLTRDEIRVMIYYDYKKIVTARMPGIFTENT